MERQRVFDETLPSPPPGFEFGVPRARIVPGQLQQQASYTDIDVSLDISKGTIVPKGCKITSFCSQGCGVPPDRSFLSFAATPSVSPPSQSFHAFCDGSDCGDPAYWIDGYASLKIDLSVFPFAGNQITLISLFANSFQARVPIGAPPDGSMNLLLWGPSGVGSDWLNGAGTAFYAASVLPSANETLTPHTFSPNLDLSGLSAFYVEAALHTIESFPDNQDAYINPETLRLRVSEIIRVIVQADGVFVGGATVNIFGSNGVIVATGTTLSDGIFTAALPPGSYFAQSVLGSLAQTSPLLAPISQTLTFTWLHPKPSVTFTESIGAATTVFFDASASIDPHDLTSNDTFLWNFGDGTSQTGKGLVKVTHSYNTGTYIVTLSQTSPDGLASTLTLTIVIATSGGGGGGGAHEK